MSVSSVITSLYSQISSLLGSDWKELKYVYEPEKNDFRSQKQAYGVAFDGSNTVEGTTKAVTYDSAISVLLATTFNNRGNDSSQRAAVGTLLDKKELLDKNIFQKKLNNSTVLLVQEISTEPPELIADNVILMRFNYIVKTRNQTV